MEALVVLAIIIGLLWALDVSLVYIAEGLFILMMLVLGATLVFFAYTALTLIGSKKCSARFDRIDKPEGASFPSAVYVSDGEELRNAFPNEFVLKKRLYKSDKEVLLRLTGRGRVYDLYSRVTVYIGVVLAGASLAALIAMFRSMF